MKKITSFALMENIAEVLQHFPYQDAQCSSSELSQKLTWHKTTRYALINKVHELWFLSYGNQTSGEQWSVTRQFVLSEKWKNFYRDIPELIAIRDRFNKLINLEKENPS